MDNSKVEKFIDETKRVILSSFDGFEGIYFFGSRFTENWTEDSDLDLLFVFNKDLDWKEKKAVRNKIFEIELKYDYMVDAKIFSLNQIIESNTPFRESINQKASFYAV